MATGRPRGHTTSGTYSGAHSSPSPSSMSSPLSRISSPPGSPRLEEHKEPGFRSSFRLRSRSHSCSPAQRFIGETVQEEDETRDILLSDMSSESTPWMDAQEVDEFLNEPWTAPPTRDMFPITLQDDWEDARSRVSKAALAVMGVTTALVRRALVFVASGQDYVPIPGLVGVAKLLLLIWDLAQVVDMNRLACMRLARRCGDIVLCVRHEVRDAGDIIHQALLQPLIKLVQSFRKVRSFLEKQLHSPFLKRFLKRDEILKQIKDCNDSLTESIGMFNLSIQVRILRQVQESEFRRAQDTELMMNTLLNVLDTRSSLHSSPLSIRSPNECRETPGRSNADAEVGPSTSQMALQPAEVLPTLRTLHTNQNTLDTRRDIADLRMLMRHALDAKSDVEMMNVLKIRREEMPAAIGILENALDYLRSHSGKEGEAESQGREITPTIDAPASLGAEDGLEGVGRDELDREFVESGIDALRRMSMCVMPKLPSWTITRYEIDPDEKIGVGFFSDVFRGTWRGQTVAIKILADVTPRELFVREVKVWKDLRHENVLELYGASSAEGNPPWFFVSPYASNGSLVEYLKRVEGRKETGTVGLGLYLGSGGANEDGGRKTNAEPNLSRFMWEIAKGMAYLHDNGVLHGDLKAANVLVDAEQRCIITDFGQSEMKSEAYRISGTPPPRGTLRWQPPELLSGLTQLCLTPQMDVYAYAICCVEILNMGKMPYHLQDDETVRYLVLTKDARPSIPPNPYKTEALDELLRICWHRDPAIRPPFRQIVHEAGVMHKQFTNEKVPLPGSCLRRELSRSSMFMSMWGWDENTETTPTLSSQGALLPSQFQECSGAIPPGMMLRSASQRSSHRRSYSSSSAATMRMPEVMLYLPGSPLSHWHRTCMKSSFPSPCAREYQDDEAAITAVENQDVKSHRRISSYSLTLPRGDSSPISLGAVGYVEGENGPFQTLFNAFYPENAAHPLVQNLPSLFLYIANAQREKKKSAQSVWDTFVGMISPGNGKGGAGEGAPVLVRRPSISMRSSPKSPTVKKYTYVESFEAAQKWFQAHADTIFQVYGTPNHIRREEIVLVTGTLEKPDEPLFISLPAGQTNVYVSFSPEVTKWVRTPSMAGHGLPILSSPPPAPLDCVRERHCLEARVHR